MTSIAFGDLRTVRRTPVRRAMAPAVSPGPRTRLRLTSRGRVVVGSLAVAPVLVGALLLGVGAPGAAAGGESSLDTFSYVSVAPGQTLWQLAESLAPAADPRDVVTDIMELNRLESASLVPGQRLAIPAQYTR